MSQDNAFWEGFEKQASLNPLKWLRSRRYVQELGNAGSAYRQAAKVPAAAPVPQAAQIVRPGYTRQGVKLETTSRSKKPAKQKAPAPGTQPLPQQPAPQQRPDLLHPHETAQLEQELMLHRQQQPIVQPPVAQPAPAAAPAPKGALMDRIKANPVAVAAGAGTALTAGGLLAGRYMGQPQQYDQNQYVPGY